jgi:type IV pilus assembly protein PilA
MKNLLKNQKGFTLVELMVVVAIIGILAAIGAPQYQKFQAKARQTEAKVGLTAIYTAEKTFNSEASTYTTCVRAIGYTPDNYFTAAGVVNASRKMYYAIGFSDAATASTACRPDGAGGVAGDCLATSWSGNTRNGVCVIGTEGDTAYLANLRVGNNSALPTRVTLTNATAAMMSNTLFRAEAAGALGGNATIYDRWTIDQNKDLVNQVIGF